MKVSVSICILLAVFCLDFTSGSVTKENFDTWHKAWLKALCENDDENLNNEIDECMKKGVDNVGASFVGCMKEVDPNFKDTFTFRKSACPGTDMYEKFAACLEGKIKDEDLLRKLDESTEAEECLYSVMEKYGKMNDDLKLRREE